MNPSGKPIRVLIVDDSAIVRKVLSEILASQNDIHVAGTAPDPFVARDKILALEPDVVTLDIEMPRMDGLTFLDRLMRYKPRPVVVISSLAASSTQTAVDALRRGAVEVLAKPGGPYSVGDLKEALPRVIRAAAASRPRQGAAEPAAGPAPALAATPPPAAAPALVVAIGASTGGTRAVEDVLKPLPAWFPPIVVTQHIPAVFSRAFADRLNQICPVKVVEASDGMPLQAGLALVAPGDYHLEIEKSACGWRARVRTGEKVWYQRPSVDVLFRSVARAAGSSSVGVLLTGMGGDGADGMLDMRRTGALTIAQDEATSVVWGMPRAAVENGAAAKVAPLGEIPGLLLRRARS